MTVFEISPRVTKFSFWFFMSSSILLGIYLTYLFYKYDVVRNKLISTHRTIQSLDHSYVNQGVQMYTLPFNLQKTDSHTWALKKKDMLNGSVERLKQDIYSLRVRYMLAHGRLYEIHPLSDDGDHLYCKVNDICTPSLFPECAHKTHIRGANVHVAQVLGMRSYQM